jgi:transposase
MARTLPVLGEDKVAELNEAWKKKHSDRARKRLRVIRLVAEHEFKAERIAGIAGVSRASVFNWLDLFLQGGVAALLTFGKSTGRPAPIPTEVSERLGEAIKTSPMRTAGQICDWLKAHEKLDVKPHAVYRWLGKVGWVLKMPRKTHLKKDEALSVRFREELAGRLATETVALECEDFAAVAQGRVRVWVADEHRHGLLPVIRSVWAPRGTRVTAPYATKYEWVYSYEALEIDGAHSCECLLSPVATKEASALFLKQIVESDPDSVHIVIWDGAGFHAIGEPGEIPSRVRLIKLPPYSPELNPVEALGDITKDGLCNRIFDTLGKLEQKLIELLRPFLFRSEKVRGLIPDWMRDQANATALS